MGIKLERIKKHLKENKEEYIIGGLTVVGTVVVAILTRHVMREMKTQSSSRGIVSVTANRGIVPVIGERAVLNNVSFINSYRKGAPSWIIRCIETGEIFTSQLSAAKEMGISPSELSQHLNGKRDYVQGYTFERICLAA